MTRIRIRLTCREGVEHPTHVAATKCDDGEQRFACPARAAKSCWCADCDEIHAEFIGRFGRRPHKTHDEAMTLRERRHANEESWRRVIG